MSNTTLAHTLDQMIESIGNGQWPPFTPRTKSTLRPQWTMIANAFHGSLDAAKALHDALLPGWWYVIDHRTCSVSDMDDGPFYNHPTSDNPARAWLLAILKAYRAQVAA